MYRSSSYFWSKILSETPMSFFVPFLVVTITYFGIGFNDELWYKYPQFLLAMCLIYNSFAAIGYIMGTAIASKEVINILTPVVIVPTMLFTGFFVNQDNIPWYLTPFQYLSIFKYGYQSFFLIEFTDLKLDCMTSEDPALRCDPIGDFDSPETLETSLWIMFSVMIVGFLLSFGILWKKSGDYE